MEGPASYACTMLSPGRLLRLRAAAAAAVASRRARRRRARRLPVAADLKARVSRVDECKRGSQAGRAAGLPPPPPRPRSPHPTAPAPPARRPRARQRPVVALLAASLVVRARASPAAAWPRLWTTAVEMNGGELRVPYTSRRLWSRGLTSMVMEVRDQPRPFLAVPQLPATPSY